MGDLRNRLTSRKFLAMVFGVMVLLGNGALGNITMLEAVTGMVALIGAYQAAEGIADAAARLKPDIPPNPPSQ